MVFMNVLSVYLLTERTTSWLLESITHRNRGISLNILLLMKEMNYQYYLKLENIH